VFFPEAWRADDTVARPKKKFRWPRLGKSVSAEIHSGSVLRATL